MGLDLDGDSQALAASAEDTAALQMGLVLPAVIGIGFAARVVFLLVVGPMRDLSDQALTFGRVGRWDALLLSFEMPARRVVDLLFLAVCGGSGAWLATLVLWRYFGGDRLALASVEGLKLHPTYCRSFLPWSNVVRVERIGIGWFELPAARVTTKEPVKAWLMPSRSKIAIGPLLRSEEQADNFVKAAEQLREATRRQ